MRQTRLHSCNAVLHLGSVAAEFLAQCQRRRVLQRKPKKNVENYCEILFFSGLFFQFLWPCTVKTKRKIFQGPKHLLEYECGQFWWYRWILATFDLKHRRVGGEPEGGVDWSPRRRRYAWRWGRCRWNSSKQMSQNFAVKAVKSIHNIPGIGTKSHLTFVNVIVRMHGRFTAENHHRGAWWPGCWWLHSRSCWSACRIRFARPRGGNGHPVYH